MGKKKSDIDKVWWRVKYKLCFDFLCPLGFTGEQIQQAFGLPGILSQKKLPRFNILGGGRNMTYLPIFRTPWGFHATHPTQLTHSLVYISENARSLNIKRRIEHNLSTYLSDLLLHPYDYDITLISSPRPIIDYPQTNSQT